MKRVLLTAVAVLVIQATILAAVLYSGIYNVSQLHEGYSCVDWLLNTAMRASVRQHSTASPAPDFGQLQISEGFEHYEEMCVQCHGAPGAQPNEIAKGLHPSPPDLTESAREYTVAQLFWITKHGLKFTAMPGWGATHDDAALWNLAAFIKHMPQLSSAEYQQLRTNGRRQKLSPDDQHHEHTTNQASKTP